MSLFSRVICPTSLELSCVPLRAAALINIWVSVWPCCTVAGVRKRLQASGIERGRSGVQRLMTAEHWPAKQVICG